MAEIYDRGYGNGNLFWNGHHRPADYAELNSYPVIRYYNRPNTSARVNLDYRLAQHSSLNFNYLLNATVDRMNQETSDETKGDGGRPTI